VLLDVEGATTCVFCQKRPSIPPLLFHCPHLRESLFQRIRIERTATPAERVRLVVALSETGGTLRCIAVSTKAYVCRASVGATYSF
jgi:hypothetical protein